MAERVLKDIHFKLGEVGRLCELTIDGVKQRGVRAVTIHASVDEATTVSVEYIAIHRGVIEGNAVVRETTGLGDDFKKYQEQPA